jgi:hypothetical protein
MNRKHFLPEQYVSFNSFVICVEVQTKKNQNIEIKNVAIENGVVVAGGRGCP